MTPDAAHHPLFAVAEASCLVLGVGALAERAHPTPRLVQPVLVVAALGMAVGPTAPAPRLLAAIVLLATACLVPFAARWTAHLAPPARQPVTAAAPLARIAAGLALAVMAVIFAATSRPSGEPVAIALAVVLVGLLAASLPAPEPTALPRLSLPGAGLALLAASLPGVPAALLVMPVVLPLLALGAGTAILRPVAASPGAT